MNAKRNDEEQIFSKKINKCGAEFEIDTTSFLKE